MGKATPRKLAREIIIVSLSEAGMSAAEIGRKYNLTRQRVWQILKRAESRTAKSTRTTDN